MKERVFTCPGPVPNPLEPTRFRDIVYMWFYATMTCYDAVSSGLAQSSDLMVCLRGKLDPASEGPNAKILKQFCEYIANDAAGNKNISNVNSNLRKIVSRSEQPWPGQHPGINELDSILVSPGLLARRAKARVKKAALQGGEK